MEPDPLTPDSRRVEAYLDQILAPLARRLSPFHRGELRRELREHLWARIDAYSELGQSEDEAVTEALRQFGGAEGFLRQWRREWAMTGDPDAPQTIWRAALAGLRFSLPALLFACLPVLLWVSQSPTYYPVPWLKAWLDRDSAQLGHALAWIEFVMLPAGLGIAIGRRAPQRAGLGAFAAMSAEIMIGATLDGIGLRRWPQFPVLNDLLGEATLLEVAWMPIVCLVAALTGWWVRRSQARSFA